MRHFLSFFSLVLLNHVFSATGFDSATAPGDIIIGGLFPIHESVNVTTREDGTESRICNRFNIARLVQSLIMVQAVEDVNKRHELGNLTLGYYIVDSCSDVTTALMNTQSFMKRNDGTEQTQPPVLAVVGDYYSEISIAVTRHLHLEYIPQISYGATSGVLSDKARFPSFMRTVPEDDHQAQAIVEILQNHNWTWVGVVTTDSDYGRYIVEHLQKHAANKNICFAFTSIIPDDLGHKRLNKSISATVQRITENKNVSVIVSFARPHHMMYIFEHLLKVPEGRGKVWVASDIWSETADVVKNHNLSDIGTIFGTTLKSGNSTRLKQYLGNLDVNPQHHKNNTFLYKFLKEQEQKNKTWKAELNTSSPRGEVGTKLDHPVRLEHSENPNATATDVLMKKIYPYAVFSVELAVRAIAQAVADLCVNRDCKTNERLDPVELREALRKATFLMHGKNYSFDSKGDLNSGYDIILWRQTSPTFVDVHYVVAHYSIENESLTFVSQKAFEDVNNVTGDVVSRCSESCRPGQRKQLMQGMPVCCYECQPCPENYFSNSSNSPQCYECNKNTDYSSKERDKCLRKKTVFLYWTDVYHHVLQAFTALGALLTIVVGIIFLARWNTPVVRSSVGPICIILLLSLLSTFVSVILFGGEPNDKQCQARQVLFGLSFTMCVSCIMVKSFKIILAFEFDPSVKRVLKKLYKPYIIIAVCMAGQVLICALWLSLGPPVREWQELSKKDERLLICYEKSFSAFGAMLGYIGVLALICFGVAFKGRKLPESYNDAKFITFAMLIYFICWIIFGPVYVNVIGRYHPAVEMVVILISAYGILFCQFFVKCYIILFKQKANTEAAFRQDVRNYSLSQIKDEAGNWVLSPFSSGGIQNTAVDVESQSSSSDQKIDQIPSMSSHLSSFFLSASNPRLIMLQSNSNKRQLRRYLSSPA
ncbi:G-protein coupled receptor family C group 6 member A-like isoform X1 [Seriola aureovittata]|uniref:G-protein coupled receptor family C group 6 member A-like isoform X1 n=2 Tax=Seriola aureovittata TaxID=2871759 RepID=UPI0024BE2E05|nr:G-protein coupled receptor family C group 6 member A-like isoform X1 [Seriola aureovittata]